MASLCRENLSDPMPDSDPSKIPSSATPSALPQAVYPHLPPLLQELATHIPMEAVLAIADHYGGRRLRIATTDTGNSALLELIGEANTRRLCRVAGGCVLDVPKADSLKRYLRNREILVLKQDGVSQAQLSRRFGLTCRQIRIIINHQKHPSLPKVPL